MSRLEKLRQKMREENLDAFIVASPENRRYLSGFTGTSAVLFIEDDRASLLTDFRYIQQAAAQAPDFQVVDIGHDLFAKLGELGQSAQRIGFEEDYTTYESYVKLKEALSRGEFVGKAGILTALRSIKEETEISLIRQAVKLADDAFAHILKFLKPGQSEEEIAVELEFHMRRAGASAASFDFIVASGWRSALPHGVASPKTIEKGELLTLDFGAVFHGYCSDITRTVCLGEPNEKQRQIYDIVLTAQKAGIEAVKPGRTGKEVDAIARQIIADAGYGEYFGHGLGHSVGLAIHESPRLSVKEEKFLEPGMVLTVEPGIYIPGWGGVRIEDMVLVTENGCEVLTQAPKNLIIID